MQTACKPGATRAHEHAIREELAESPGWRAGEGSVLIILSELLDPTMPEAKL